APLRPRILVHYPCTTARTPRAWPVSIGPSRSHPLVEQPVEVTGVARARPSKDGNRRPCRSLAPDRFDGEGARHDKLHPPRGGQESIGGPVPACWRWAPPPRRRDYTVRSGPSATATGAGPSLRPDRVPAPVHERHPPARNPTGGVAGPATDARVGRRASRSWPRVRSVPRRDATPDGSVCGR